MKQKKQHEAALLWQIHAVFFCMHLYYNGSSNVNVLPSPGTLSTVTVP